MKKAWKRVGCVAVAAALCAGTLGTLTRAGTADASEVIFYAEFEDAFLITDSWSGNDGQAPEVIDNIYGDYLAGYSGDGFIYQTGETLSTTVTVPEEGMYEIIINYAQILDDSRMQTLSINDTDYTFEAPYSHDFVELDLGRFRFQEGENTLTFKPYYGYCEYDTITIQTADSVDLSVSSETSDPNATAETRSLMNYLTSVYGTNVISGQQEIYGGGHDDDPDQYEKEFEYIYETTGEYPAIRGFDFMNYNPLYGWDDGTTERVIEWVNDRGGIATACWHINIPSDFDSYVVGEAVDWTECTYALNSSFDVNNVTIEGTKEKAYVDLAIECLAEQFQMLQDANVPIIFRLFHEAEGNGGLDGNGSWFWWSQDGVEAYKNLWMYVHDELMYTYGLHNIIWEENLYAWSDESAEWYIGDDYVDIVGFDKYDTEYNRHDGLTYGPNEDADSSVFYSLVDYVDGKKMVSMPENSTIPSLSNIQTEEAWWLYFCTWYDNGQDNFISGSNYQNTDTLIEMYQSDVCITLSELPDDLYTNTEGFAPAEKEDPVSSDTEITEPVETTEASVETTEASVEATEASVEATLYGDINLDNEFTLADVILIIQIANNNVEASAFSSEQLANANCYVDDAINAQDALTLLQFETLSITSLPVYPE